MKIDRPDVDGAPAGFAEFVVVASPQLLRTAWLLTGDAHLAEDLLQTALARTWPHWERVGADRPHAYVWRVMVNLQASWWRRQAVVLRYYLDLPERQVAELMGCSVGTVKSQCAKGLATLRTALGEPADVVEES